MRWVSIRTSKQDARLSKKERLKSSKTGKKTIRESHPRDLESWLQAAQTAAFVIKPSAESEVIGHIGAGQHREDIAAGVIDSVAAKVANLLTRYGGRGELVLTGGFCDSPYFLKVMSEKTGKPVLSHPDARYAGAIGAALTAARRKTIEPKE